MREGSVTKNYIYPLTIIGAMFFIFGFITWAIGVLIPYLQIACELTNLQSMLVGSAFYVSYFVMSPVSGYILKKLGYKNALVAGLICMAIGSLIFVPAANQRAYPIFLLALFVQGLGMAILQTAANPYVTILGPIESGAKRMSIMGICNSIAAIIGPAILGSIILQDADNITATITKMSPAQKAVVLDGLASKVIVPYIVIAVVLALIAIAIYYSRLPEPAIEEEEGEATAYSAGKTSILQFPHLLLGVFTLFIYVGVEVIAGNTIAGYGAFLGISYSYTKFFTSLTLGGMFLGYIIGISLIPKYLSQENALKISAILGMVFVLLAIFSSGWTSVMFIALLGLANSLMYPAIWPLALEDVGRFTKTASTLLVAAIVGGAVLPLIYGALADAFDQRHAYWMVIPGYFIIALYAFWGHKVRTK